MKHLYYGGNTPLSIARLLKKNHFFTTLLLLTCCCCWSQLFAGSSEITISQEARSLIAPEAESYQWYYNNEPLEGESSQNLKVTKSGFYTVVLSDKAGKQSKINTAIAVTAFAIKRIFLIGDSTVANYNSGYYPQTGWGQVLQPFFNPAEVTVVNKAVGGTSSKNFYTYFWTAVKNSLAAGDYVFIGFGINDSNKSDPERYTEPNTTFKEYLTRYVNETKARGAIPVLVSTVCRNAWNSTNPPTVYPSYHGYPVATRELAASLNVPLIDLDRLSTGLLESVGPAYSGPYLYMNLASGEYPNYSAGKADNVHFQESGAIEMARLVTQALRNINSPLVSSLAPTYPVNVSQSNGSAGLVTRTQSFPAGINVTLKVKPNSGYSFQRWVDGAGTTVTTSQRLTFTMGSAPRTYQAIYPGSGSSITIQENTTGFCSVDGSVDNNNTGYTGAGFANTNNAIGAGVSWRVNSPNGGTYSLVFRHSNGGAAARGAKLMVNGTTAISSVNFPVTGSFSTWGDVSVNVTLPAGSSDIRLEALTADGTSNIDYLRIAGTGTLPTAVACSGGSSSTITIEENTTGFCGVDGTVDNNNAGFTGTGFANTNNATGAGVLWRVNAPASGTYTLLFRHSNGGTTDRTAKLIVNGVTSIASISFPTTGNFTTWADVSVNVTLPAGGSNIRLEALTGSGTSNIDYLRVTGASPSGLACSGTIAAASSDNSLSLATDLEDAKDVVSVFPNPSSQQFTIQSKGDFKYSVLDLSGRIIEKGAGKDAAEIGSSLAPGTYVLSIDRQGTVKNVKIIKN